MTITTPPSSNTLTTAEASAKIKNIINPADPNARKVQATETEGEGQEGKDDKAQKSKPVQKKQPVKSQGKKEAATAKPENPKGDSGETDPLQSGQDETDFAAPENAAETTTDPLLSEEDAETDETVEADEEDAEGEEGQEEEALHTVVVDGEEVQVAYSELLDGYMRLSDYSKKMAQVQTERKDLEAQKEKIKDLPEVKKKLGDESARFNKNAQLVLIALEKRFMPQEPSAELAKTDPASYIKMKEARQEAIQFMQGIGVELQKNDERMMQDRLKDVQEGRTRLMQMLPELKDAANRQKLRNYAKAHGFSDEQIAAEPSPVLFQWAWKASKYDELMQRRDFMRKRDEKARPKVLKQSKAPEGQRSIADRKRAETFTAHKRTGNLNTATAAISGIIRKKG